MGLGKRRGAETHKISVKQSFKTLPRVVVVKSDWNRAVRRTLQKLVTQFEENGDAAYL
jgi:hypothetical protein